MFNLSVEEKYANATYLETNGNNSYKYPYTVAQKTGILAFMSSISAVSIIGNTLVFVAYYKTKALQTATNYFILSLAMADLLVAVFVINIYTMYMILDYWPFRYLNYAVCVFWLAVDYWLFQSSVFGVLLIAGDR